MMKMLAGLPVLLNPREGFAVRWTRPEAQLVLSPNISASLTAEDDFELGGEFLDVFLRAGERVMGFFTGCLVVAAVWMIVSTL
jgi:hypothetical protein